MREKSWITGIESMKAPKRAAWQFRPYGEFGTKNGM